ncbi:MULTISPECIES: DUF805 domain-containing protein [unclassified Leifsonia]|uniref:DUF805 domain-containing protein n=1 Tax=unclassified Leifsonia TaxID=2663824 RepID=UPI0006FC3845|nr:MULTISPECIES: DUF805 domain-containing protein [unclassified Leifsonia]KQX07585.1 hypothetical protein ASC59_07535 [Leifsonia sp. Root1293]KRA11867.1 hypothetical protein ASD61_07535 [Leifsonia sp. Root60]
MTTAPSAPATPLDAPLYGASFGQAVSRFWSKYATFSGRASRSEFWWSYLFLVIVSTVLYVLFIVGAVSGGSTTDAATGLTTPNMSPFGVIMSIVYAVWGLAVLIPTLAISWRRLHDTNRSGGFWFLGLIPFVGSIIVLVFLILDSDPAGARFDRR